MSSFDSKGGIGSLIGNMTMFGGAAKPQAAQAAQAQASQAATLLQNQGKDEKRNELAIKAQVSSAVADAKAALIKQFQAIDAAQDSQLKTVNEKLAVLTASVKDATDLIAEEIPRVTKRVAELTTELDDNGLLPTGELWTDLKFGMIKIKDFAFRPIEGFIVPLVLTKAATHYAHLLRGTDPSAVAKLPTTISEIVSGFTKSTMSAIDVDSSIVTVNKGKKLTVRADELKSTIVTFYPVVVAGGLITAKHATEKPYRAVAPGFHKLAAGVVPHTPTQFGLGYDETIFAAEPSMDPEDNVELEVNLGEKQPAVGDPAAVADAALIWFPRISYFVSQRAVIQQGVNFGAALKVAGVLGTAAFSGDNRWAMLYGGLSEKVGAFLGGTGTDYLTAVDTSLTKTRNPS